LKTKQRTTFELLKKIVPLDSILFFLSKGVIKNYIIKKFKSFIRIKNYNKKFEHPERVATLVLPSLSFVLAARSFISRHITLVVLEPMVAELHATYGR
jgi:hypothetical protein